MKILFLVNHYNTLRVFRKEFLIKLSELGHKVLVSLPFAEKEYMEELKSYGAELIDTPVERRGTNPIKDFKLYNTYKKIIKNTKPDLIFTYTIKPNIYGIKAASDLKVPCFATITGLGSAFQKDSLQKKIIICLYKWALHNATAVFFQNEENRDTLVNLGIINKNLTALTPGSGVNTEEFPFTDYPTESEKLNFLYIGRIMKEKGMDELFEAIENLNKDYHNLNFEFIGWYEDDYKEKVNDLINKKYITYHGFQNDVKPYIEKCHCVVIPSYHEGMNNSLLEASSMGRPVITTNIHGCKEAVTEGKTGLLCEVRDSKSLFDTLLKFIKLPYEEKKEMGRAARSFMEQKFKKDIVINIYLDEINKINKQFEA